MEPNRQYIVDFISRMNALTASGVTVSEFFKDENQSWWALQQFFLFAQIETFNVEGSYEKYTKKQNPRYGVISRVFVFFFYALVVFVSLVSILVLKLQRPLTLTFSSDFLDASPISNPRMKNIYAYFSEHNILYAEIIHLTKTTNFFKNLYRRLRPSIYLEAFTTVSTLWNIVRAKRAAKNLIPQFDFSDFNNQEKDFAQHLFKEAVFKMYISKTNVALLKKLIHFLKVKSFISSDDFRYIPELCTACEEAGISSHVFQHSNFGFLTGVFMLPPEEYVFPTIFYTWNAYWKKRVQEISPLFAVNKSRIQVGGRSFDPAQPTRVSRTVSIGEKIPITVLVPYEVTVTQEQVAPYMKAFLSDKRISILFMPRGTTEQFNREEQHNKYFGNQVDSTTNFRVIEPTEREWAIKHCDLVVGVYSGFLDESLETGIPVCVLKTDFINVNRLDKDHLASLIDIERGDLYNQLLTAYLTSDETLKERRERVNAGTIDIEETLEKILK